MHPDPTVMPLVCARRRWPRTAVAAAGAVLLCVSAGATAQSAGATAPGETVSGSLVRAWSDPATTTQHDDRDAELLTWVDTAAGETVQVETEALDDVPDGSQVTVRLGKARTADAGRQVLDVDVLRAPSQAPLAAAATPHTVSVVMALPPGSTRDAMTLATVKGAVTGAVSSFWSEQTAGAVSFAVGTSLDWTPMRTSCSDPFGLWDEAASKVGFVAGAGRHLLLYIPPSPGCGSGIGTVGNGMASGGYASVSAPASVVASVVAHEFGHNFSLGHSDALLCPTGSDGPFAKGWGAGCAERPYDDWFDVMGISWGKLGSLSTAHADRLGVLGPAVARVTTPTRTTLSPVSTRSGTRALRVSDPAGATYYVEYRPASGRDAFIASNPKYVQAGVLVRRLTPDGLDGSVLLDGSPTGSGTDRARALPVGATMRTASGKVAITVEKVTATQATVAVSVNGVGPAVPRQVHPVFADVFVGDYFYSAVDWAVANRVTNGTAPTLFSPYPSVSRGQAVTFMWNSAGRPVAARSTFTDVPASSYFSVPTGWASASGITSGMTSGSTFSPHRTLVRAEVVTMLWRLSGRPAPSAPSPFTDVSATGDVATAITWAASTGLTKGKTPTTFDPQGPVTRAQLVTFLHHLSAP